MLEIDTFAIARWILELGQFKVDFVADGIGVGTQQIGM